MNRGDDAETAVASDGETEEFLIFLPATAVSFSSSIDEGEGFYVIDDGPELKPASVDIGGK